MYRRSNVDYIPYTQFSSPEACYVLGFIWADGYLLHKNSNRYRISVEITNKDFLDIENTFDKHGSWCKAHRNRPNRQPQSSFIISNRSLFDFLIENDYDKKSYIDPHKILSKIPEESKHFWFRGYFDGDGCFYINKKLSMHQCHLCSSYDQDWSSVSSLLDALDIYHNIRKRIQKKSKHSVVRWTGKKNCVKFGDYIYKEYLNIGLTRKYEKYLSMMI